MNICRGSSVKGAALFMLITIFGMTPVNASDLGVEIGTSTPILDPGTLCFNITVGPEPLKTLERLDLVPSLTSQSVVVQVNLPDPLSLDSTTGCVQEPLGNPCTLTDVGDGKSYLLEANVGDGHDLSKPIEVCATIILFGPPGDTNPDNNTDCVTLEPANSLIFADGFESGDTSAWSPSPFSDP